MDDEAPRWDPARQHEFFVLTRDDLPDAANLFAGYHAPGRLCFYVTIPRLFPRDKLQYRQDDERVVHEIMAELHTAVWKLSFTNEPCEDHPPETHLVIHIEYADAASTVEEGEAKAVVVDTSKGPGSESDLTAEIPQFGRQDGVANAPLLPSITAFTVSTPDGFPAHAATFYQIASRMPNLKFLNISAGTLTLNTAQHTQLRNELADSLSTLPQMLQEIKLASTQYYTTWTLAPPGDVQPRSDAGEEPDRLTLAVRKVLHMPNLTQVSIAMSIDWELFCTHIAPGMPTKRGANACPTLLVWLPYWAPSGVFVTHLDESVEVARRDTSGRQSGGMLHQIQKPTSVVYIDEVCFHAAKLAAIMPGDFTFFLDMPGFRLDYYCWRETLRIDYNPSELRPIPKTSKDPVLSSATRAAWRNAYELQRHRPGNFNFKRPQNAKLSFEINSRIHCEFV